MGQKMREKMMGHDNAKLVTWGRKGSKSPGKNGDVIYGEPLSSILEPGGISQWDGIEGFLAPELGFYVLLRHD